MLHLATLLTAEKYHIIYTAKKLYGTLLNMFHVYVTNILTQMSKCTIVYILQFLLTVVL